MSVWKDDYMITRDETDEHDQRRAGYEGDWEDIEDVGILCDFEDDGRQIVDGEAQLSGMNSGANGIMTIDERSMSIQDSFILSMRNRGYVDIYYMTLLTGASESEIVEELSGSVIWLDPEKYDRSNDTTVSWVSRQQLLKGNLYKKLNLALSLQNEPVSRTDEMEKTILLLREELPDMVSGQDIHINLGSSWVPSHFVEEFIQDLLGMIWSPKVKYDEFRGVWTVESADSLSYANNNIAYGTPRISAVSIIKRMLNAKPVMIYDTVPNPERDGEMRVLNKEETIAAQEKQKLIMDAWQDFVHGDPDRESELQELYMSSYGYKCTRYDGSFIELSDMVPVVTPYTHQKNAIAHILLSQNTLLAHEVGSGKTLEICAGVHELIRIGLGHKAMIVVPNTTYSAMVDSYRQFYPDDRILAVSPKKDFKPDLRDKTISDIKSGDHDVIIMAYSSFDMFTLSRKYTLAKKEERLREYRAYIQRCTGYSARSRAENELIRLYNDYEKTKEEFKDVNTACFDELGVDILVVDEAHNYKNITIEGRVSNIVGMHHSGSAKANRMLEKVRYIQGLETGHVIFATGTPITNSLADLYVLQTYLQPVELSLCHIDHFNDWINTFCERVHSFEVDVDSKNFRFTTRFAKFHNIPELMAMFSEVCDFYQITDGELKLPDFNGYRDVLVHRSEAQKSYIDKLADRTDAIRSRRVSKSEDNLLKITVDGRKCALDIRLVVPDIQPVGEENKCICCADRMADIYFERPGTTQIAFCDISTPKNEFNIYDELKKELVKRGVAADDIEYIHDAATEAQREKIEKRFNAGEVRILIGSTMKLGTGANVQERLIAVHHMDVPWRPADMVQREGRIIRQGNINKEVFIYRYVTEASFDSYTWQILENKQKFIAQFLSGTLSAVHREETDTADTVLNYAEIKALAIGNPLIRKRVDISNQLEHARINQRQKRKELIRNREWLENIDDRLAIKKRHIQLAEYDDIYYRRNRSPVPKDDRRSMGEALLSALEKNTETSRNRFFGSYQGFQVILPDGMKEDKPYVLLRGRSGNDYRVKMDGKRALGCSKRLDNVLDDLPEQIDREKKEYEQLKSQKSLMEQELINGNEFDSLVENLFDQLKKIDDSLKGEN